MKYIFCDESINDKLGFIVSCFVFSKSKYHRIISNILKRNGFNSENTEFKSGIRMKNNTQMQKVREEIINSIWDKCNIGVIIVPNEKRKMLGDEALIGLKCFLQENNLLKNRYKIYFDEEIDPTKKDVIKNKSFENCTFYFNQDSKKIKGIQIADLIAHSCQIMLSEELGNAKKMIKIGKNEGYEDEFEIQIGEKFWMFIRFMFLSKHTKYNKKTFESKAGIYDVEPYGLYISNLCNKNLKNAAKKQFSKTYLGCIH